MESVAHDEVKLSLSLSDVELDGNDASEDWRGTRDQRVRTAAIMK